MLEASKPLLSGLPIPFDFDGQAPFFMGNPAALLDEGHVIVPERLNTPNCHFPPGPKWEPPSQTLLQARVDGRVNSRHQTKKKPGPKPKTALAPTTAQSRISVEDVRAVKGLANRIDSDKVRQLVDVLS
jgi:hypothetical protein